MRKGELTYGLEGTYNTSEKELLSNLVDGRNDLVATCHRNGSTRKEAILDVDDEEGWNGRGIEFWNMRLVDGSIGHDSSVTVQRGIQFIGDGAVPVL